MPSTIQFLYERSVIHQSYLIVPFAYGTVAGVVVYSYCLLSLVTNQAPLHKIENPADRYTERLESIIEIAKDHLDRELQEEQPLGYYQQHYVYRHNLIIISAIGGKIFYDHYPPSHLNNIAAPKIFASEQDCIHWVKQGLDR
ncbi:hypothetical protein C1752_01006 [Acaryochloris thomasi RCC1774]|uniref:Uncharacterized protein n=1 Tax=Acaryochloris thomasi RCC1774 TaxID=1764569 RepID=A0A2W1JWV6_9CYAN|nr:hypothetical protein [Acaryochloris thomasi]PZD74855.1 hypothetical protein C1752_01006 [Acaryochloris thomasi RCC1774]